MALGPVSWRASCILGVLWMLSCGAGASGADAGSRGVGSQMPPQLEIGSKSDGIRYAQHQGSPADALWLLYLFLILGVTAEKFFCPNLSAISTNLRLAHNVAGVTFLAFGNGAPDVFSAVVAFSDPRTAGLAIGALFGAGVFVTTVVAGGIALLKPFTVASRPFLRDAIFYMVAVFLTFTMLYFRRITLAGALSYLGLYIFYVLTVVICTWIHKRQRGEGLSPAGSGQPDRASDPEDEDSLSSSVHREEYEEEYRPLLPSEEGTLQILTNSMNPLDRRKWRRKSCYWRFLKVFKMPVEFVMLLTVPVVDPDQEDHNWKRPLNCLHLITSPLVCILTLKSGAYGLYKIQGVFPVWGLGILIGAFLAAIVFCTTKNEEPPKYHCVFAFLGFLASALWINAVATEVVNVLRTLGVVFQLSNTVLGLTLLAWGNSIGAGAGWSSGLDSSWSTGAEPGVFLHNSAGSVLPAGPRVRSLPPPLLPGFPHGSFADGVQGDPTPCPLTASPPDAILSLSTSGENGGSGLMSLQGLDQPADGEGARGDGRMGQMQVSH
uniref:Sodium/calcium exchanger membrane region domain-containing protein n=1 Tax=Gopherus agassizii TaxID=38772 RepID=A0A452GQ26_9SAUR